MDKLESTIVVLLCVGCLASGFIFGIQCYEYEHECPPPNINQIVYGAAPIIIDELNKPIVPEVKNATGRQEDG